MPLAHEAAPDPQVPGRERVFIGSKREPIARYYRALRDGKRILVSGTTANHGIDHVVAPGEAGAQSTYILDKIAAAVRALGGKPADILQTRMYLQGMEDVNLPRWRMAGSSPPARRPMPPSWPGR